MKNYPHPPIAKEGWLYLFLCIIVTTATFYYKNLFLAIPCTFITLFVLQFFRDPNRTIPQVKNAVLSPADGRIICIENTFDIYQKQPSIKVSIFMNVFNVHSNRSPVTGKITSLEYFAGKFVNASFDKASSDNERNAMIIELATGQKITVVQIAGLIARRILCYKKIGEAISSGQRYGFIRFGSRVDLYLPTTAKVLVTLNQKVKATSDIIAEL